VWGYFSVKGGGAIHEYSDSQFGHLFAKGETRQAAIRAMVVALKEIKIRCAGWVDGWGWRGGWWALLGWWLVLMLKSVCLALPAAACLLSGPPLIAPRLCRAIQLMLVCCLPQG
jgi:hypothetical protein